MSREGGCFHLFILRDKNCEPNKGAEVTPINESDQQQQFSTVGGPKLLNYNIFAQQRKPFLTLEIKALG